MKVNFLKFIAVFALAGFAMSCETDRITYEEKDAVYFNLEDDKDSIYFSLAGTLEETDTLRIPLKILGNASSAGRQFRVTVDASQSTAQEGLHYQKLQDAYEFPANEFETFMEIVLSKADTTLATDDKVLALTIEESEDFAPGFHEKASLKVYFTNKLIMPEYWDFPLKTYFGEYSKVKHNLAISIMGHDFPPTLKEATTDPYSYQYWMIQGRATCAYIIEHDVYDENGNKILPWPTL